MTAIEFAYALVAEVREIYDSDDFIPLHAPSFGDREKYLVQEAIDSTFVSSVGQSVIEFETSRDLFGGGSFFDVSPDLERAKYCNKCSSSIFTL